MEGFHAQEEKDKREKDRDRRIVSALPVVVLQGLIIYGIAEWLAPFATLFYSVLSVLSALFVLFLISKSGEGAYKMFLLPVMFVAPLPVAVMSLFYGNRRTAKKQGQSLNEVHGRIPLGLDVGGPGVGGVARGCRGV